MSKRKRLPETRPGLTRHATVGKMDYYVTVNFYPDSADPGEVFIKIAKEGSIISGFVDALCITISIAWQYGVPWKTLGQKYLGTIFEPRDDEASSLVDGISQTITCIIDIRKEQMK